jgi:RimJ/RimL family protein N-acetyltransferase
MTPNWNPELLENELIKLIPLQASDFEALFEVASDPLIWEQHPANDRYQRDVFKAFFEGALATKTTFLILDKITEKPIGSTRYYDFKPESSSIAIGFTFISRDYWGGPHNRSTKKLLMEYAFQFVNHIYFHIGVNNIRSQKAILKIGATKVRELDFELAGKILPHCEYVVHKNELVQA